LGLRGLHFARIKSSLLNVLLLLLQNSLQDMIENLATSLGLRLSRYAEHLDPSDVGTDEEKLREVLKTELERLAAVPFGIPLLHQIG
jgi:hypothetical protein